MKVLIIKTSSLGDIIHAFPAVTEAAKHFPEIKFDWVVEESFQEIPAWHPYVNKVIPVALRRWRKALFSSNTWHEWKKCREALQAESYDYVIDAQGLMKSAFLSWFTKGLRCGLDKNSAWESWSSWVYQKKCAVDPNQHAIKRVRELFSGVLDYALSPEMPGYGLDKAQFQKKLPFDLPDAYVMFLHGTTWATKHWSEEYWCALAGEIVQTGLSVCIPWSNEVELARAKKIAAVSSKVFILPRLNLAEIASVLGQARAVVAVDTGLGHLSAALSVPTLSLYGPTDPAQIGTIGENQIHFSASFICAPCLQSRCSYKGVHDVEPPCFSNLPPEKIWKTLKVILKL